MSGDHDLEDFVKVLGQRLATVPLVGDGNVRDLQGLVQALEELGVLELAVASAELDDALLWLASTVRTCARFSPSVAYALAARFAAHRIVPDEESATASIADDQHASWRGTVPTLFAPGAVVLLRRVESLGRVVAWADLDEEPDQERTGLKGAGLRTVLAPVSDAETGELPQETARAAIFELDVLHAAVGVGLLEGALATAEEYAANRRQFGQPVVTFAGLAAILVEMRLRASAVSALLAATVSGEQRDADLVAITGRACVDTCLEAIQVHGGYGYIDEFPVAGMLRDAVSLRARGGGRRAATAAVAARHLPRDTVITASGEVR